MSCSRNNVVEAFMNHTENGINSPVLGANGRILNQVKFDQLHKHWLDLANAKYGIRSNRLFRTKDGIATPIESVFEHIDDVLNNDNVHYDLISTRNTNRKKQLLNLKRTSYENTSTQLSQVEHDIKVKKDATEKIKRKLISKQISLKIDKIRIGKQLRALERLSKLDSFSFIAFEDLQRAEELIKEGTMSDLTEVRSIVGFYSQVDPTALSKDDTHPIFERSELFDDKGQLTQEYLTAKAGNMLLSDIFTSASKDARRVNALLEAKEKSELTKMVNDNARGKNFTTDQVLESQGKRDINIVSMLIQNPAMQIGAQNPVLAQAPIKMFHILASRATLISSDFDKRLSDLEKNTKFTDNPLLKAKGEGIFKNLRTKNWNIFQATDKYGQKKNAFIQRFSIDFLRTKKRLISEWDAEIEAAEASGNQAKQDALYKDIFDWHRENEIFFDLRASSDLLKLNDPENADIKQFFEDEKAKGNYTAPTTQRSQAKTAQLKEAIGSDIGLDEVIEEQKSLIRTFLAAQKVFEDSRKTIPMSPKQLQQERAIFNRDNNPFFLLKAVDFNAKYPLKDVRVPQTSNYGSNTYISRVPRRFKVKTNHIGQMTQTKELTGNYDSAFSQIEQDTELREFHKILTEFHEDIYNNLDPEDRAKYDIFSLPAQKKTLRDIASDPTLSTLASISAVFKAMMERLINLLKTRVENTVSHAKVDPVTGAPIYRINRSFLNTNKRAIDQKFQVELSKMKKFLGLKANELANKNVNLTKINLSDPSNSDVLGVLASLFGVSSYSELSAELPNVDLSRPVDATEILRSRVEHNFVAEQSFDLPKIIRSVSHQMAIYKARKEVLPHVLTMQKYFNNIKNPETDGEKQSIYNKLTNKVLPKHGKRQYANIQQQKYIESAILGNYDKSFQVNPILDFAFTGIGLKAVDSKLAKLQAKYKKNFGNQSEQAKLDGDIESQIQELKALNAGNDKKINDQIRYLESLKLDTKQEFSVVAFIENVFYEVVRIAGLGWNASSSLTNYMEGQLANMIMASSEKHFSMDTYWRATNITKYIAVDTIAMGKAKGAGKVLQERILGAKLARAMMKNYDVLQDVFNEFQKATVKSKYNGLVKALHPKSLTSSVEFQNQMPILVGMMMEQEIVDANGNKSFLWDELMNGAKEHGELGKLSKKFATSSNKLNFEISSRAERQKLVNELEDANPSAKHSKPFDEMLSHVTQLIIETHGDYHQLRGNMLSSDFIGQGVIMMKKWVGSALYTRFGNEQYNLFYGKQDKGRYKSFTPATGTITGATVGILAGPMGMMIGAGIGAGVATLWNQVKAEKTKNKADHMSILQEAAWMVKDIGRKIVGFPVNAIAGKEVIKSADDSGLKKTYTEVDVQNLKSISSEIVAVLLLFLVAFLAKAAWYSDDDERDKWGNVIKAEDTKKRFLHNLVVNRTMQMIEQTHNYFKPLAFAESFLGTDSMAPLRYSKMLLKFSGDMTTLLTNPPKDILASGRNIGESKAGRSGQKLLISPFKDNYGFGSEKQYQSSWWDDVFIGEKTKKKRAKKLRNIVKKKERLERREARKKREG